MVLPSIRRHMRMSSGVSAAIGTNAFVNDDDGNNVNNSTSNANTDTAAAESSTTNDKTDENVDGVENGVDGATPDRKIAQQTEDPHFYQRTLMVGRYSRELGEFAAKEAERARRLQELHDRFADYEDSDDEAAGARRYMKEPPAFCKFMPGGERLFWRFCDIVSRIAFFVGEEWLFLFVLGLLMAVLSYVMDVLVMLAQDLRLKLFDHFTNMTVKFVIWNAIPCILVLSATVFVNVIAPQAIGSGIPEMKTILRGVVLKEYLSLRALFSKCVGLTLSLGSGLPLGKEGPFVHIASIVARQLSRFGAYIKQSDSDEKSQYETLAAASAVGVACSFAAPIGGVLFSIEVTSVYFAVRNYWRGFFAAVCAALCFRLLAIWFDNARTITALFSTSFRAQVPFEPLELFVFAGLGVCCGLMGALFVFLHRKIVEFQRRIMPKYYYKCLPQFIFVYPVLVTVLYSTLMFPPWLGQYMGGRLSLRSSVSAFFFNVSWLNDEHLKIIDSSTTLLAVAFPVNLLHGEVHSELAENFSNSSSIQSPAFMPSDNSSLESHNASHTPPVLLHHLVDDPIRSLIINNFQAVFPNWPHHESMATFLILTLYIVSHFIATAIAITLPVPAGMFIPVFVLGAAFGRLVGELMALCFPQGITAWPTYFGTDDFLGRDVLTPGLVYHIIPGAYAVVGAAALSGAATHTISTSVIVAELTGQIGHIIPVMIAVLIANFVAKRLQPSIYDSIIRLKRLPYLPHLDLSSVFQQTRVEDIMVRNVKYVTLRDTFRDVRRTLFEAPKLAIFPMVDSADTMVLLGSITRRDLQTTINKQLHVSNYLNYLDTINVVPQPASEPRTVYALSEIREKETDAGDAIANKINFENIKNELCLPSPAQQKKLSTTSRVSFNDIMPTRKQLTSESSAASTVPRITEIFRSNRNSIVNDVDSQSVRRLTTLTDTPPPESTTTTMVGFNTPSVHRRPIDAAANGAVRSVSAGADVMHEKNAAKKDDDDVAVIELTGSSRFTVERVDEDAHHSTAGSRRSTNTFNNIHASNRTLHNYDDDDDDDEILQHSVRVSDADEHDRISDDDFNNNLHNNGSIVYEVAEEEEEIGDNRPTDDVAGVEQTTRKVSPGLITPAPTENTGTIYGSRNGTLSDRLRRPAAPSTPGSNSNGGRGYRMHRRHNDPTRPHKSDIDMYYNTVVAPNAAFYYTANVDAAGCFIPKRSGAGANYRASPKNSGGKILSRVAWEQNALEQPFDFSQCHVDASPFQVVEKTSLSKLHRLFSLLGIQIVYATSLGRLVGVISVGDFRRSLESISNKTPSALGGASSKSLHRSSAVRRRRLGDRGNNVHGVAVSSSATELHTTSAPDIAAMSASRRNIILMPMSTIKSGSKSNEALNLTASGQAPAGGARKSRFQRRSSSVHSGSALMTTRRRSKTGWHWRRTTTGDSETSTNPNKRNYSDASDSSATQAAAASAAVVCMPSVLSSSRYKKDNRGRGLHQRL